MADKRGYDPNKNKDSRYFSRTASAVHKRNSARPKRGGYRL